MQTVTYTLDRAPFLAFDSAVRAEAHRSRLEAHLGVAVAVVALFAEEVPA